MKTSCWLTYMCCILIVSILGGVPVSPIRAQEQRPTKLSPNELLEAAVKRAGAVLVGFRLAGPELAKPPGPGFRPIQGLDNTQVVPFLINVLENGPAWTDEKLLKARGGIYPHIARCYAALCLGSIGDRRAYEPLVRMLQQGTYLEEKLKITYGRKENYHISDYAALALGYLGDPNAIGPLINALQKDKRPWAVYGLTRLRDIRAIKPIIEYASDSDRFDSSINRCLEYISGVKFRTRYFSSDCKYIILEFPELGKLDSHSMYKVLWQHWLKEKDKFARLQFEKYYPQWKSLRDNRPDDRGSQYHAMRNMVRGGVPTLALLMGAIEKGDESLVPVVSELTESKGRRFGRQGLNISSTATRTECLTWWQNNKNRWKVIDANGEKPSDISLPR